MMQGFIRRGCLGLTRLFYSPIVAANLQRVPAVGPCIVIANHPSGLLDAVVLRIALGRPLGFLGKSTFWGNPVGRAAVGAFGGIPVYRARDGEDTARNEATFALCRKELAHGGWLALFPEGTSHSDPSLKPLKTGAARIALSALAELPPGAVLRIVPAGLVYEAKETFRSSVAVEVGEPLDVRQFAAQHGTDFAAAQALTAQMAAALGAVTLQADSDELWRGLLAVAAWTDARAARDLAVREARARELAAAYRALAADDPEQAQAVVEETRRFVRALRAVGVDDPFALEAPLPGPLRILQAALPLLLLWPFALPGAVLCWLPYRAVGPLARRFAGAEHDLIGTLKVLGGLLLLPLAWLAEAGVVAMLADWRKGLAVLALAPLLGYVALRYGERLALRKAALRAGWLRLTRAPVAAEIASRRQELARTVEAALHHQPLATHAELETPPGAR